MKRIKIEQTWLDRVINHFSPERGIKRLHARARISMATGKGGYIGADRTRRALSEWKPTSNDADADVTPDLDNLRDHSRDLIRNTPIAAGAINTKVTNVVGSGIKLQSQVDNEILKWDEERVKEWQQTTEREFKFWAEKSEHCDIEKTLNFYEQQDLAFRSTLESGDVFVLLPMIKEKYIYKTRLQLIEADRISNPNFQSDDDKLIAGVEKDENGAPLFYHIADKHPGNRYTPQTTWTPVRVFGQRTGRRNVLHLYRKIRVGLTRGIPDLAPVIEPLKQLDRYTEAEVMAAVISSMFTVFIKSETGLGGDGDVSASGKTDDGFKLSSGAMLDLRPGEDISIANPGRPNAEYDPFVMSIYRQIGVALELPMEILIKHFTSSYSASRAAMLEAWRFFIGRRHWLIQKFCQPVYETWMDEAVSLGRIVAPGYFNDPILRQAYLGAMWIGPPRGQIDPVKENQADEIAEDRGWKTASENTAERGGDWETKHRQRVIEVNARKRDGLESESAPIEPDSTDEETDDETEKEQ